MKKNKGIAAIIVCALLVGTCLAATASIASTDNNQWQEVSEDYYKMLPLEVDTPVLTRCLQDSDYAEVWDGLIDTSREPDYVSAARAAEDPNAALADNMLPDGRFLKDNWVELGQERLMSKGATSILTMNQGVNTLSAAKSMRALTADGFQAIATDGKTLLLPENAEFLETNYAISPDGSMTFAYDRTGIKLLSGKTRATTKITPEDFNGKTYEMLADECIMENGSNLLFWADQITPAADNSKLTYISNKGNFNRNGVYLLDLVTGEETVLQQSDKYNYLIVGWLTEQDIMCYKIYGDEVHVVVIDLAGEETTLNLPGDGPDIMSIRGSRFAYTTIGCARFVVADYDGSATPQILVDQALTDGYIAMMPDVNIISPDGAMAGFVFIPKNDQDNYTMRLIDIETQAMTSDISHKTSRSAAGAGIYSFTWADNTSLLVNLYNKDNDMFNISTWTYTINGGIKK